MAFINEKSETPPPLPTADEPFYPPMLDSSPYPIQPPEDLDEHSTIQEAKKVDVHMANNLLKASFVGLTKATCVSSLCQAINQAIRATEHRRKVLLLQYGAESNGSKSKIFDPLD